MKTLRIALAQINPTVGDLSGNSQKILNCIKRADKLQVDLISFPELSLPGYPPEDLLLRSNFIEANIRALEKLVRRTRELSPVTVIGYIDREHGIFNAAAIAHRGKIYGRYRKMHLPNYGVFDEVRYFRPGHTSDVYVIRNVVVGISICEDIWYPNGPAWEQALLGGAEVIINISSSPYHAGKIHQRRRMLATRAADNRVIVAYNNLVGGQDELVFDGGSMIFDQDGEVLAVGHQFEEDLLVADLDIEAVFRARLRDPHSRQDHRSTPGGDRNQMSRVNLPASRHRPAKTKLESRSVAAFDAEEEIYGALCLGTRDYVSKNGFESVVIGLSGGIDSALTACVAADALGRERVIGVSLPSRYTSSRSRNDARTLAENLGIRYLEIPIGSTFKAYKETLKETFRGREEDVTEENLQARIRGNLLMALSNKFGHLVLTTGNKSEMGVGYCTLYGDMAGGFAVLKDVPKTLVQTLAAYRNRQARGKPIPKNTLTRPPSAELRPGQRDTDSLPEYSLLDPILHAYVEEGKGCDEIVAMGYSKAMVRQITRLVDRNEYKRRQGPPGIKITPRAFGRDWRVPITNHFEST